MFWLNFRQVGGVLQVGGVPLSCGQVGGWSVLLFLCRLVALAKFKVLPHALSTPLSKKSFGTPR